MLADPELVEAEAIRQFNLAESPPIATRFAEVSRLVTAMTGMKNMKM